MKLITKIIPVAVLLGSIAMAATSANAYPARAESSVNVRSGPGTQYDVVGQLDPGERVNVSGSAGGWSRIGGGWVSSNYLSASARGSNPYNVGPDPYSGTLFDRGSYYDAPYYNGAPPVYFGLNFGGGYRGYGHRWH